MKTELFIIKNNEDYIKIKKEEYSICALDKASVFPMDKLEQVKTHIEQLKKNGFPSASIYKLLLTEQLFKDN